MVFFGGTKEQERIYNHNASVPTAEHTRAWQIAKANPDNIVSSWGSNGHGGPSGWSVRKKPKPPKKMAPAPKLPKAIPSSYKTQKQTRATNPYYRAPEQPNYISADATQARENNIMGQGIQGADPRYQTKQLDKAGLSRGAGQRHRGAVNSARTLYDAAREANEVRASDFQVNANLKRDYNDEVERRTQFADGMQQRLDESDWQRQFQQNSLNAQLFNQYNSSLTDILVSLMS